MINIVLKEIDYRPTVIQDDGGFICGFIACLVFKYLLDIDDKDRNLLNAPKSCLLFGNRKKDNEKVKALTLRK